MKITSLIAVLFAALVFAGQPERAHAGLFVSITVAPPVLPVYVQPPIPGPGYIWSPGYWAWDDEAGDYYWVPGTWVPAPAPGLLWTPGYWGWSDGAYVWNAGYWGPHVGFYGGVNYGFGYGGVGFGGGIWVGGVFSYNKFCTNVGGGGGITNVYNKTVIVNNTTNISFNGGAGGIQRQPNAKELAAGREQHTPPSAGQMQHQQTARANPESRFKNNGGRPQHAATSKPGDFSHSFAAKSAGSNLHGQGSNSHNLGGNQHNPGGNSGHPNQNNFVRPKGTAMNTPPRKPGPPPQPKRVNQPKPQPHQNNHP